MIFRKASLLRSTPDFQTGLASFFGNCIKIPKAFELTFRNLKGFALVSSGRTYRLEGHKASIGFKMEVKIHFGHRFQSIQGSVASKE